VCSSNASLFLFRGRGRAGEEEKGSNAGKREVAGLFAAGVGETVVSERVVDEAMGVFALSYLRMIAGDCSVSSSKRVLERASIEINVLKLLGVNSDTTSNRPDNSTCPKSLGRIEEGGREEGRWW